MTEFRAFLASLYDALSDAEVEAAVHGRERLSSLLEEDAIPADASVPVYHASDVEVTLNVRLEAEHRKEGLEVLMKDAPADDPSTVTMTLDVFDLVDRYDLDEPEGEGGEGGPGPLEPPLEDPRDLPVDRVHGIGDAYRDRLTSQGVRTLGQLVELSADELAEMVSGERIDIPPERTTRWIEEAQGLMAVLDAVEGEQPVELVDGIGSTFGRRLREHGIEHLSDLVQHDPEEVASLVSTEEVTISPQQAAGWLEQAEVVLRSVERVAERVEEDRDRRPDEDHAGDGGRSILRDPVGLDRPDVGPTRNRSGEVAPERSRRVEGDQKDDREAGGESSDHDDAVDAKEDDIT